MKANELLLAAGTLRVFNYHRVSYEVIYVLQFYEYTPFPAR